MEFSRHVLTAAAAFAVASIANAANVEWTGDTDPNAGGNWSNGANWDSGAVPTAADRVIFPDVSAGVREIVIDQDAEARSVSITQSTSGGATAIMLDADLDILATAQDLNLLTVDASSETAVSFNLNGHAPADPSSALNTLPDL